MFKTKSIKNIVRLFFMLSIVSCLQARLANEREIKGLSGIQEPFSPITGWLLLRNGCIRKIYDHGPANDATTKFTKLLFNRINDDLNATTDQGHVATYFDAETVGLILNTINGMEKSLQKSDENSDQKKKVLISSLIKIIKGAIEKSLKNKATAQAKKYPQEVIPLLKEEFAKLNSLRKMKINAWSRFFKWVGKEVNQENDDEIISWGYFLATDKYFKKGHKFFTKRIQQSGLEDQGDRKKLCNDLTSLWKIISENESKIELVGALQSDHNIIVAYYNSLNTSGKKTIKTLRQNELAANFAQTLVDAYNESNQLLFDKQNIEFQKYPQNMPTNIFLAFLISKIQSKAELKKYATSFQPSILKDDVTEKIWTESFEVGKEPVLWKIELADLSPSKYEELCYALINNTVQDSFLPGFLGYHHDTPSRVTQFKAGKGLGRIEGLNRADCNETSVLNLFRITWAILGCIKNQKYDLTNLPQKIAEIHQKISSKITLENIQEKLKTLIKLLDGKAIDVFDSAMNLEWLNLISNLDQVKYLIKCNLKTKLCEKVEYTSPVVLTNGNQLKHGSHMHEALDKKDFFVFELTGLQSSFIEPFNVFCGFNFKNLKELCDAFSITTLSDISNFDDDSLYNRQTSPIKFNCTIENKPAPFAIEFSIGHAIFTAISQHSSAWEDSHIFDITKKIRSDYRIRNIAYGIKDIFKHIPEDAFTDQTLAYSLYLLGDFSSAQETGNTLALIMKKNIDFSKNKPLAALANYVAEKILAFYPNYKTNTDEMTKIALLYINLFSSFTDVHDNNNLVDNAYDKTFEPLFDVLQNPKVLENISTHEDTKKSWGNAIANIILYANKKTNKSEQLKESIKQIFYFLTSQSEKLTADNFCMLDCLKKLWINIYDHNLHNLCQATSGLTLACLQSGIKGIQNQYQKTYIAELIFPNQEMIKDIINDDCENIDPELKSILPKLVKK